ncbi:MAG: S24/S26 family peptidase [Clostridia bacterium]|nr:S24/S26 family peptidase [Clostridia bacterium]
MRELVNLKTMLPLLEAALEGGSTFRFFPNGTSMLPMIEPGKDEVVLGAVDDVRVGDIFFYRRPSGQYVLHRLIDMPRGGSLTFAGDGRYQSPEFGVQRAWLIAKLVAYYKDGVLCPMDTPAYRAYTRERVGRFPFYRKKEKIYNFLRMVKHALKPKK